MTTATAAPQTDPQPQMGLDERQIEDTNLEALLDRRAELLAERKEAQAAFKEKDDAVKARIAEFDLGEQEVARCGRYRIEKKVTKPRSVAFETGPGSRLAISLFED